MIKLIRFINKMVINAERYPEMDLVKKFNPFKRRPSHQQLESAQLPRRTGEPLLSPLQRRQQCEAKSNKKTAEKELLNLNNKIVSLHCRPICYI